MVNKPLIRLYFWGGRLGGCWLTSHKNGFLCLDKQFTSGDTYIYICSIYKSYVYILVWELCFLPKQIKSYKNTVLLQRLGGKGAQGAPGSGVGTRNGVKVDCPFWSGSRFDDITCQDHR